MKADQIIISVIVPAYNLEMYIGDCIDSVRTQSLHNIELILVDDCSDDHTKMVIKKYMEQETVIDIILLENDKNEDAGYSRNRGMDIARGEYLLFLDGDDMLEPGALERLCEVCRETEADIVNYDYQLFDNKTNKITKCNSHIDALMGTGRCFQLTDISACAFQVFHEVAWDKLFRRAFVQENSIRFQSQSNANDQFFVFAALVKAKKIVKISDCLLNYRINRENQLSASNNISKKPQCIWRATKAAVDYIEECGLYELFQKSVLIYIVERLIFSLKNVGSKEAETLLAFYQNEGLAALKVIHCSKADFGIPYFFAMYNGLVRMKDVRELKEAENWRLWDNEGKCKRLLNELTKEKKIVLWGAGVNGGKFMERACAYNLDIRHVVDMAENKIDKLFHGHKIVRYEEVEEENLIVVLNPAHIPVIRYLMIQQNKKVRILDARAYLRFDFDYDQAKVELS